MHIGSLFSATERVITFFLDSNMYSVHSKPLFRYSKNEQTEKQKSEPK